LARIGAHWRSPWPRGKIPRRGRGSLMALLRPVRVAPSKPTADKLRRLMSEYGIRRSVAARLMRRSTAAVSAYLARRGCGWGAADPHGALGAN
jgi:hypothetical protein